jgi:hypothetical protein
MGLGCGDGNAKEAHAETFTNREEDERIIKLELRPCHIPNSHRLLNSGGLGSIQWQSMWDLKGTKWHRDTFFPPSTSDHSLSIIITPLSSSVIYDPGVEQNSDLQPQFQGTRFSQRINEGWC